MCQVKCLTLYESDIINKTVSLSLSQSAAIPTLFKLHHIYRVLVFINYKVQTT